MEQIKIITPVDVLQELIAIHTTRIDAASKLMVTTIPAYLSDITNQSNRFIKELLGELANYGDAVQSTVDRDNDYHNKWKNTLGKAQALTAAETANTFKDLEKILRNTYKQILEEGNQLPLSVSELIARQSDDVSQSQDRWPGFRL